MTRILTALALTAFSALPAQTRVPSVLSYGKSCVTQMRGYDQWDGRGTWIDLAIREAIPLTPVMVLIGAHRTATPLPGLDCDLLVRQEQSLMLVADATGRTRTSFFVRAAVPRAYFQAFPAQVIGESPRASNGVQFEPGLASGCESNCAEEARIIGCDDRVQGPNFGTATLAPWSMVGRVSANSGSGTGTLIAGKYVLTAAHVVFKSSGFISGPIAFRLAQSGQICSGHWPFGTRFVRRVFVPTAYNANDGSAAVKSYDVAILELKQPIDGGQSMAVSAPAFDWISFRETTAIGYPADKALGTVWSSRGAFSSSQPYLSNGSGAGVLRVTNDGWSGMSGGPLFVWMAGERRLVGVFIGSSEQECKGGHLWAARITKPLRARVNEVLTQASGSSTFWRVKTYLGKQSAADVLSGCK